MQGGCGVGRPFFHVTRCADDVGGGFSTDYGVRYSEILFTDIVLRSCLQILMRDLNRKDLRYVILIFPMTLSSSGSSCQQQQGRRSSTDYGASI